jgi:hypothetical protein
MAMFLLIFLIFLQQLTHVVSSAAAITLDDVQHFNYIAADALMQEFNTQDGEGGNDNKRSQRSFRPFQDATNSGSLVRLAGPTAACLASITDTLQEDYNFDGWKAGILQNAGVSVADLTQARESAADFEAYQETKAFQAVQAAFMSKPPMEGLLNLQNAADECMKSTAVDDGTQPGARTPTTKGTIVYMGLHFEAGLVADGALSLFWALGKNDRPTTHQLYSTSIWR